MTSLDSPIETFPGVGEKVLEKLRHLKIKKVFDLLFHLPFRYDDFSQIKNIADLVVGEKATVTAKILNISAKRTWKRKMFITEALLEDATAPIRAVWFNQPYLTGTLKKGLWVNISGKVSIDKIGRSGSERPSGSMSFVFSNPVFEVLGLEPYDKETLHTGGLVAIYPETAGLTSRWLRLKIKMLLDNIKTIPDFLPTFITKEFGLINLQKALNQIHFPKSETEIKSARKRLSFGDIFLLQLHAQLEKEKTKSRPAAPITADINLIKKFIASLPFQLTDSQKISAWQILKDIGKHSPMNRILVGDVGSGKTVVAAIAALNVASQGYQTAFMAPTEILANQHFKTLSQLLANWPLKIGLLTSSKKLSRSNLDSSDIVIGTHALIQKTVQFKNLALVVVDEQHRFGVDQRAALLKDPEHSSVPHLLSMSATPIPRTLALTLYGELDLSILKELPKGRKKIITKVVSPTNREKAYQFIENQIKRGRQAFVICP
ncbi:MAG: DEAD/DEAH box helicase, partial [Parcubacteria group bacterium]|nr:DEAD/DEAH box helicase [Parcubacteria group bacterium]